MDLAAYLQALVPQEAVRPISGRGELGTWQAVYLWEHRARAQHRQLSLPLLGE